LREWENRESRAREKSREGGRKRGRENRQCRRTKRAGGQNRVQRSVLLW
jgi:hypothetical protein